jgi:glycosyltransferase involved in cell wall biosynthesis
VNGGQDEGASRARLLLCTPRFAPQVGGAETWTREICRGLAARGHQVAVVSRGGPGLPPRERVETIDVTRVPGGRVAFARAIRARIRADRPDAVLAQYSALPAAVLATRRARTPCVGVVHDVYGLAESVRIKGPVPGLARTLGLEQWLRLLPPDALLVPSTATATRLARLISRRPITVVPAGADHLAPPERTAPAADQVVFVGRLVPQKGVGDIIDAVTLLRARGIPCRVVIIGEGPLRPALEDRASALGDGVRFAGSISDAELDRAIRDSLALILPSRREGWGLAVTEAASRGTPYIAYDIPAVREQHELLQGGLLVSPEPQALAGAIEALLRDPTRAERLGDHGRKVAATMTWAGAAAVVERAISEVARGAR